MDTADVKRLIAARACAPSATASSASCCRCICIDLGYDRVTVGLIATATLLGSAAMTLRSGSPPIATLSHAAAPAAAADGRPPALGFATLTRPLAAAGRRVRRHAQPVHRRRQRIPAPRAAVLARASTTAPDRPLCALRARRARWSPRSARWPRVRRRSRRARPAGHNALASGDVRPLRLLGLAVALTTAGCRAARVGRARAARRSPVAQRRPSRWPHCSASTRSAAASSCSRCWRCGCTSASTSRSRHRHDLLRDRRAERVLLSRRRAHRATHRPRQHDGVHAPAREPVPGRDAVHARPRRRDRAPAACAALLSQMDVPTRSSYVMAMVSPEERPAAASITAVPRSLASAASPLLAGYLLRCRRSAGRWCCGRRSRSCMTCCCS